MTARFSATYPSPSERDDTRRPLVLIADPGASRTQSYQRALSAAGVGPAVVVDYRRLLRESFASLRSELAGAVVRLDSPGTAPDIQRAIIERGLLQDPHADPLRQVSHPDCANMVPPRAWALGWRALMHELAEGMREQPGCRWLQDPLQVAVCFDKLQATETVAKQDVPTPEQLGPVAGFEALRARMRDTGGSRVFVKVRHGASATGCVAIASSRGRFRGVTTVVPSEQGGRCYPFNSLRLNRLESEVDVAHIVDLLAGHDTLAEAWVPKAVFGGHAIDVRILVLDGEPTHAVVRMGSGPMTNLHLGNDRLPIEALQAAMPASLWPRIQESCRAVARTFPGMQHVGVDVAVTSGLRGHRVLEVNAFGDELNHVLHGGLSPHEAQVQRLAGTLRMGVAA